MRTGQLLSRGCRGGGVTGSPADRLGARTRERVCCKKGEVLEVESYDGLGVAGYGGGEDVAVFVVRGLE